MQDNTNHMLRLILDKTEQAFNQLLANDRKLFVKRVHEQTVVFRLGLYLQELFPDHSVDCEYNRQWNDPKRRQITGKLIKPDLIVHKRLDPNETMTSDNLLIIEAKKKNAWKRTFSALSERLSELTDAGRFEYKLGLCWKLVPSSNAADHELIWFREGDEFARSSISNCAAVVLQALPVGQRR